MSRQTIRQVIAQRARVEELSQGEDYYEIEKCWKQLVDVVCEDLDEAIRFLEVDCTEDEFSWISEVLDDIARRKEGGRFLENYKSHMSRFSKECDRYHIREIVALAEQVLSRGAY